MATNYKAQDAALQQIANINPEAADKVADILGYGQKGLTSNVLTPSKAFTLPPQPTPQSAPQYITESSMLSKAVAQSRETAKSDLQGSRQDLTDTFRDILGVQQSRGALEEAAGIPKYGIDLANIQNSIDAKQQAILKQVDELRKNSQGLYGGALEDKIAEVQRVGARDLVDLRIQESAITRNMTALQSNIDRKIELELEPLKMRADFYKLFYEENRDAFDKADDRMFQTLFEREQRVYEQAREDKKEIRDLSRNALENGAPPDVAARMAQAETVEQAMQVGGSYVNMLDRRSKLASLANADLSRRLNLIELAKAGDQSAIKSLGYDPNNLPLSTKDLLAYENAKANLKRDSAIVQRSINNDIGLQSSSGLIKGGVTGAFFEGPFGIVGSPYTKSKRQEFLADAQYVIKNMTFDKIQELTERGIKLTPISDNEFRAMAAASGVLVSAARFDGDGNLTGFDLPEYRVRQLLTDVQEHHDKAMTELDIAALLKEEDRKEIEKE